MNKMRYPLSSKLRIFEDEYASVITSALKRDLAEIEIFLDLISFNGDFKDFLLLSFEEILNLAKYIDLKSLYAISTDEDLLKKVKEIKKLFNYTGLLQNGLSHFFMKNGMLLDIKTCYYCNIEYVNPYVPFENDYRGIVDFISKCTKNDLMQIKNIGEKTASKILTKYSGTIKFVDDLDKIKEKSLRLKLKNLFINGVVNYDNLSSLKNHYTLDHILPQSRYPFLSLCLYNLVPTCYTCNSKLKKNELIFKNIDDWLLISPTSDKWEGSIKFDMFFEENFLDNNVAFSINSYTLQINPKTPFVTKLNLQGRYNFHKNESLKLINKRKIYSDSQIQEIAKILSVDVLSTKKSLFGSSLFDENANESFIKYKKDVAKQLKIL